MLKNTNCILIVFAIAFAVVGAKEELPDKIIRLDVARDGVDANSTLKIHTTVQRGFFGGITGADVVGGLHGKLTTKNGSENFSRIYRRHVVGFYNFDARLDGTILNIAERARDYLVRIVRRASIENTELTPAPSVTGNPTISSGAATNSMVTSGTSVTNGTATVTSANAGTVTTSSG